MVLIFGLVLTLVLVATLFTPKEYTSSAKLFVRLGRENSSMDATATLGQAPVVSTPLSRDSEIKSISEMILNRSLFEEVVDEIGPQRILKKKEEQQSQSSEVSPKASAPGLIDRAMEMLIQAGIVNNLAPREKAIIKLRKNLHVEPIDKTTVVLIQYETHSPELAQQVVQLITEKYLIRHAQIHRSQGAYKFLDEQTERLRKDLNNHEKEYEKLRQSNRIVDIDAQRQVLVNRLAKVIGEKLGIDARYTALEEEIRRLADLRKSTSPDIVVEETIGVGNEGVDGMRQELFRLEIQKEDLLSKFAANHSRVKAIENQIASTKTILEKAEGNRKESKRGPNPVYQQLEKEINAKTPEMYSLKAQSEAYQTQINEIIRESEKFAELETTFTQLKRKISIEDANYRKYVNNLEEARIDSLLKNENLSNISIAQPASFEPKPSKPNKLINLVLGFLLGSLVSFGWAIYREFKMVMSNVTDELSRDVELPVVGSLRSIPQSVSFERELVGADE